MKTTNLYLNNLLSLLPKNLPSHVESYLKDACNEYLSKYEPDLGYFYYHGTLNDLKSYIQYNHNWFNEIDITGTYIFNDKSEKYNYLKLQKFLLENQ